MNGITDENFNTEYVLLTGSYPSKFVSLPSGSCDSIKDSSISYSGKESDVTYPNVELSLQYTFWTLAKYLSFPKIKSTLALATFSIFLLILYSRVGLGVNEPRLLITTWLSVVLIDAILALLADTVSELPTNTSTVSPTFKLDLSILEDNVNVEPTIDSISYLALVL